MELVNQQLMELEKSGKNYVIEGYPRTRSQAIGLQKMGIMPDKFFILNANEATISKKIRTSLTTNGNSSETGGKHLNEQKIEVAISNAILEYNM